MGLGLGLEHARHMKENHKDYQVKRGLIMLP